MHDAGWFPRPPGLNEFGLAQTVCVFSPLLWPVEVWLLGAVCCRVVFLGSGRVLCVVCSVSCLRVSPRARAPTPRLRYNRQLYSVSSLKVHTQFFNFFSPALHKKRK